MVWAGLDTFHQTQICVSIAQFTCSLPCELQHGHPISGSGTEISDSPCNAGCFSTAEYQ